MQTEVVRLALDLLVREPDIEGFFGALSKTMVEESEGNTCAVWLLDDSRQRCELWMAYVKDRLFTPPKGLPGACEGDDVPGMFPCETHGPPPVRVRAGWDQTVEYENDDRRLPERIRAFGRQDGVGRHHRDAAACLAIEH